MPENKKQTKEAKYYDFPLNSRLRRLVNKKNIAAFSNALGVTQDAVRQWQAGYTRPDVDRLVKIADHFGVSIDFLLGKTETPSPNIEIQAITQYTGISEGAVRFLHAMLNLKEFPDDLDDVANYLSHRFIPIVASHFLSSDNFWCAVIGASTMMAMDEIAKEDNGGRIQYSQKKEDGHMVHLLPMEAANYYYQRTLIEFAKGVDQLREGCQGSE